MIEIVKTLEGFRRLEQDWDALADRFGTPLLRHEYFAAYIEAFSDPDALAIFVLRNGTEIQAIAPLEVVAYGSLRRLGLLSRKSGEPSGFLFADVEGLEALIRAIFDTGLSFSLPRLGAESPEIKLIREAAGKKGHLVVEEGLPCITAKLSRDATGLEKTMLAKRRNDLRRCRRRAEQFGQVQFEAIIPCEAEVDYYLRELFRIEASGWKRRAGTAVLCDPALERFFRVYGTASARLGSLRLFFLKINGVRVASRLAVSHAKRLWDLRIAYDETWRACAPGILLTHETLQYGCENGFNAVEFLGKSESWQTGWAHREHQLSSVRYYGPDVTGLAWFGIDKLMANRIGRQLLLKTRRAFRARSVYLRPPSLETFSMFSPGIWWAGQAGSVVVL